jgi:RNA polymerase sigma-70 factor (ECF subfamily)
MAGPSQRQDWIRSAVARYETPLVRYATHLLGDVDRGREAAQETFLRLCRARRERVEPHLAAWLFTVCRNLACDERRKEARMDPLDGASTSSAADSGPSPSDEVLRREAKSRLLQALDQLPSRQQELLRLKFGEGLSYKEISRVTRLSVSNVGYIIHVAVAGLRSRLADDAPQAQEVSS